MCYQTGHTDETSSQNGGCALSMLQYVVRGPFLLPQNYDIALPLSLGVFGCFCLYLEPAALAHHLSIEITSFPSMSEDYLHCSCLFHLFIFILCDNWAFWWYCRLYNGQDVHTICGHWGHCKTAHLLWPPCVADADIIFLPCGFYLSFFIFFLLFSSPILSGWRLDLYHTSTHGMALVRI